MQKERPLAQVVHESDTWRTNAINQAVSVSSV